MKSFKNYTIRFLILILVLVIADLIIKSFLINNLEIGERIKIIGDYLSMARVQTLKMAFGFEISYTILDIIMIIIQILILLVAIRIQKLNVNILYKISTVLIVCGWIGNHFDRILFSNGNNLYVHTEYISISPLRFHMSLSSLMISTGWILLILSIIIGFKDLKAIFSKQKTNN